MIMKVLAKQSMSTDIVTAHLMDDLKIAYSRLLENSIRHLPVTDDAGTVVGIISDRDFQRAMWPVQNTRSRDENVKPIFRAGAVVGDYMSWPVLTVNHD